MMSNQNALLDHAREFIASGGEADERADSLVLTGFFADAKKQADWLALSVASKDTSMKIQVYNSDLGGDLTPDDTYSPTRRIVIIVKKQVIQGVTCYFFQHQLIGYFQSDAIEPSLLVADLDANGAFETHGLIVSGWDISLSIPSRQRIAHIDPSPYVRDFVPTREVTSNLAPWIVEKHPTKESVAFASWKKVASRRLLGSLVSSVWLENEVIWLQANGPPIYRMLAADEDIERAFGKLTETAKWVFLSGQDIEARHIIFSSELARAARPDQSFPETMARAFDAAKVTYDAHVQSSSRETLKTLSDLRKTVIEETQKVTQKAQDLSAGLWRDLAVSAAPFILKILGDTSKISNPAIAAGFYFAAALFIAVSFILQWRINASFFKSQKSSRTAWMHILYNYISAREKEEIAETPIDNVMGNYKETRTILLVLYIILFSTLIGFGLFTLFASTIKAPTPLHYL